MSERIRVVLAVEQDLPESVRAELGASLEAANWVSGSEDSTCWVCRAKSCEVDEIERQVRKMIEFAGFNAGVEGRLPFALKLGEGAPKVCAVRVGSGGLKTKPVPPRASACDFGTEKVASGGAARMPEAADMPTQLKTAF